MTDLKVRYIYSMLSAIPYCLVAPTRVSEWARDAGYNGLNVAPHRGIDERTQLVLPALMMEEAWNPVESLWQALRHQPGDCGMPSNWRDWLVFPSPERCKWIEATLRGIRVIHHRAYYSGALIELCPELGMTPVELAEECKHHNMGLVLDTEHLVRPIREFDQRKKGLTLQPFEAFGIGETIEMLALYISVVHVKVLGWDEQAMIKILLHSPNRRAHIDFVAEYPPLKRGPRAVKRHIKEFLEGMKSLVESA